MKATVLTKEGFVFRDEEIPICEGEEVLVRTLSCGICEGDVVYYTQTLSGEMCQESYPGHEGNGIIEEVGPLVRHLKKGDLVTTASYGGSFSEYFLVNAQNVFVLPDAADASIVHGEPLACCVHGMRRSAINLRSRVIVLGCGYMGIVCLKLALLQGAREVVAVDPIAWRRQVAKEFGATKTYTPEEAIADKIGEFDVVIEAAGTSHALDASINLVKEHGQILVFGAHRSEGNKRNLDMFLLNFKAVDFVNAHVRRDDEKMDAVAESVELVVDGRIDLNRLVTAYPISEINTAMQDLISKKEGLFKASVIF